jgi:hypothetical protein
MLIKIIELEYKVRKKVHKNGSPGGL